MITTVVLTHNSAASLSATLGSVSWSDEVIIIDDGSTDETCTIAKKMGASIFLRALNADFAAQRNFGLQKAKGDWVLFVDSDELVSSELAQELQQVAQDFGLPAGKAGNQEPVGYLIKREDQMWGRVLRHGETANVRLLRFAKKNSGQWVRPVHEVWEVHGVVGTLTHPILHSPHPNVAQFLDKINTYSTLNARYLYAQKAPSLAIHIVIYPVAKFFANYVIHVGFLDGTPGAVVAIMMSFHSFLTRAKLWLLYHHSNG